MCLFNDLLTNFLKFYQSAPRGQCLHAVAHPCHWASAEGLRSPGLPGRPPDVLQAKPDSRWVALKSEDRPWDRGGLGGPAPLSPVPAGAAGVLCPVIFSRSSEPAGSHVGWCGYSLQHTGSQRGPSLHTPVPPGRSGECDRALDGRPREVYNKIKHHFKLRKSHLVGEPWPNASLFTGLTHRAVTFVALWRDLYRAQGLKEAALVAEPGGV